MMHKAWSSIKEVPYCFSRSSIKFQGHIALKIVEFDSNWAFPDCNSSLNSPMAMKWCTKLETAKKRCPIVFQGHPSNFKVTWDKISPILTQIGRFRTIGRSQLSNPSDLPCSTYIKGIHLYFINEVGNILWVTLLQLRIVPHFIDGPKKRKYSLPAIYIPMIYFKGYCKCTLRLLNTISSWLVFVTLMDASVYPY